MDKNSKKITNLFSRYIALVLLGLGNLYLFYLILTPTTIHTVNTILSIFIHTTLINNFIITATNIIEIVPACVAGAAFYLLLFLIFTTADIKPRTRFLATITALISFFILNIIRIVILFFLTNNTYFSTIHWIFWHLISTIFVIAIWLSVIKIYKIKSIPVYSDFKYLKGLIKSGKNSKRSKKH